jgi:DNA mismatch endonuclease (patch repair protein)
MGDVYSRAKRSQVMASVRGRGNKTTEGRFRELAEEAGLWDWREHPKEVYGSPDFVFDAHRVAIFVDGCFWHGCALCRNVPATNVDFWSKKIQGTKARDEVVNRTLEESGWQVLRFWEHELKRKNREAALAKLMAALAH